MFKKKKTIMFWLAGQLRNHLIVKASYVDYSNLCLSFLSGKHGVGRIDIVENRFIGMKSRGKELKMIFFVCLGYDLFLFVPN